MRRQRTSEGHPIMLQRLNALRGGASAALDGDIGKHRGRI
jgi:hypothetical protein